MDADQFDFLARSLTGPTRRRFSRALAGITLAGGLGAIAGPAEVDGKKKDKGKKKKKKCKAGGKPIKGKCCQGSARVCIGGCAFASIQDALLRAKTGATISLCPGAYRENILFVDDVRLVGTGDGTGAGDTILQGTGEGAVVSNFAGRVTLENLRITGGETDYGAGITNSGEMELIGCTVTGNRAHQAGGGIDNAVNGQFPLGAKLTLTDCVVSENMAGSIGASGRGAGIANDGTLRLTNSVVSGNTAIRQATANASSKRRASPRDIIIGFPSNGGGIITHGGTLTLTNSEISGNTADLGGGIDVSNGTVTFDAASRVTENTAADEGGGIHYFGGTVTLNNAANVTGNTPDNCASANEGPPVPLCSG
jgi:hypothetical protein